MMGSRAAPSSKEVSRAMRRCWQPVARTQDLHNGPQRIVMGGEALVVFLGESGKAAVLADRCGHRGGALSLGTVRGEGVQCPYHGWEWNGQDGTCTRIPSLEDQCQIPPGACISAYPTRDQLGLVWSALEDPLGEPSSPSWFEAERWRCGHGVPFELPVGFGLMIENFRDVAHFAFVHRATLGRVPETVEPLLVKRDGLEVTMRREMRGGEGAEQIWGALNAITYHTIAPNFTSARLFTDNGERCLLHAARAISATASAHYWIVGLAPGYSGGLDEAMAAEGRLYEEDRAIVSAVEPPELDLSGGAEISTLADSFTLAYRQAFGAFVRKALGGET